MTELQLDFNKIIGKSDNLKLANGSLGQKNFVKLFAGAKTAEKFKPTHGYWTTLATKFINENQIEKSNFLVHPNTLKLKLELENENTKYWESFRKAVNHELSKKEIQKIELNTNQLSLFEQGKSKESFRLKINKKNFSKKLGLTTLYLSTEGFLAYQSIGFYKDFFGDMFVAISLSLLVNILILTFARLGKFLDSGFVWILVGINILTFSYASVTKDDLYLESEKRVEKIANDIAFSEKNLKTLRDQKLLLNKDFLNQYSKNYKTKALTRIQEGMESKARSIKTVEEKIELLQFKKSSTAKTWYVLSFGTYIFIIFKLILQFSSLRIAYVAKKLKWGLKLKKVVK